MAGLALRDGQGFVYSYADPSADAPGATEGTERSSHPLPVNQTDLSAFSFQISTYQDVSQRTDFPVAFEVLIGETLQDIRRVKRGAEENLITVSSRDAGDESFAAIRVFTNEGRAALNPALELKSDSPGTTIQLGHSGRGFAMVSRERDMVSWYIIHDTGFRAVSTFTASPGATIASIDFSADDRQIRIRDSFEREWTRDLRIRGAEQLGIAA